MRIGSEIRVTESRGLTFLKQRNNRNRYWRMVLLIVITIYERENELEQFRRPYCVACKIHVRIM